jgi:hypothetical protein
MLHPSTDSNIRYRSLRRSRPPLLYRLGASVRVFLSGDSARILQPFELLDLVGNAEGDDLAKLAASVFDPLVLPSSLLNLPLLAKAFLSHHPNMTLYFTYLLLLGEPG